MCVSLLKQCLVHSDGAGPCGAFFAARGRAKVGGSTRATFRKREGVWTYPGVQTPVLASFLERLG